MGKQVSIYFDRELLDDIDVAVVEHSYKTRSHLVSSACRNMLSAMGAGRPVSEMPLERVEQEIKKLERKPQLGKKEIERLSNLWKRKSLIMAVRNAQ